VRAVEGQGVRTMVSTFSGLPMSVGQQAQGRAAAAGPSYAWATTAARASVRALVQAPAWECRTCRYRR
jgi:hypothetical protein